MIQGLDTAVLTTDLPRHGLGVGDLGTVIRVLKDRGHEVEFMTRDGETLAVVSLCSEEVRPTGRQEIARARSITLQSPGVLSDDEPIRSTGKDGA